LAQPCEVPDNGTGTVTLPPIGCDYLSPQEVHQIIDGLPPGTTLELDPIHWEFLCPGSAVLVCSVSLGPGECEGPGGTLGGHVDCFESYLDLTITGTGDLAGFNRHLSVPIGCEVHTGPRNPGDPVQTFATDMYRLQGSIIGDPDFDSLVITAGSDYGMPGPGQTVVTDLGGGLYNIDSFFDITYQIDFVGAQGSQLADLSGSTIGTIRMETGEPVETEACCYSDGFCEDIPPADCPEFPQGAGTVCLGDGDGDGIDDVCQSPDDVIAGSDLFHTPGLDGAPTPTYDDLAGDPLPSDFFGPGSDPFDGVIYMKGGGLFGSGIPPFTDTIVERLEDAYLPADGTEDTVDTQIVALDLVSTMPIMVSFQGFTQPAYYDVEVCLSSTQPQLPGHMTIRREHANGGTFDSYLPVVPKLNFTLLSGPPPAVPFASLDPATQLEFFVTNGCWSYYDPGYGIYTSTGGTVDHDCDGVDDAFYPSTTNFFPGVCWIQCEDGTELHRKRLTPEQALWAAHGVLPPEEETGDTDGDGIHDVADNCPDDPNELQEDSDNDTVGDICDNCQDDWNPCQEDADSDGIGDACDEAVALGARSCRDHTGVGRRCLDMGVSEGIEPRSGGITELEIDLDSAVGFGGEVYVDCSEEWGGAAATAVVGDTVIVSFDDPLPDQSWCVVELDNSAYVCVRSCEGDLNRSGGTTTADSLQTKIRFGHAVTDANCEWDFNLSGGITTADALAIKIRFGFVAPSCRCRPHQDPWGTVFNAALPDNGTAIEFGSADIPPIPADFFYPGSDPFAGTIPLIGHASDLRRLGMTDTMIQREGPLCFPGVGYPRPSDPMGLYIVELSLLSPDPLTVTGINPPEDWVMVMGLSANQEMGSLSATLTSAAGGTFTADVPVTPLCVFVRDSDLQLLEQGLILPENVEYRVMDFELEGIPAVHMGWSEPVPFSTSPPTDGFYCECTPCEGICFYPGVEPAKSGRQVNPPHIAAGGPGHLHYINPPPPPPKYCWYREIGWNNANCFWWHGVSGPFIRSGIQCTTLANCPPRMVRIYTCVPSGWCIHYYVRAFCR
jgi:hypothetical protein